MLDEKTANYFEDVIDYSLRTKINTGKTYTIIIIEGLDSMIIHFNKKNGYVKVNPISGRIAHDMIEALGGIKQENIGLEKFAATLAIYGMMGE